MGVIQTIGGSIKNAVSAVVKVPTAPIIANAPAIVNKQAPVVRITRVQFERIRVDIKLWRDAVREAELPYFPFRVKMQQIFQDTVLNEHIEACVERRKDLTLLRDFKICDITGEESEELTAMFKKPWFELFQSYCIDARFYGYNLLELGDIINDEFKNLSFVKRQNVSPDRQLVSSFSYMTIGEKFLEPPFKDWYIWVTTPTENKGSVCGYGLFYKIARAEIFLRNNIGQNADYNEVYGQPIRVGKTSKTGDERDTFEASLRDMGSNPYLLLDTGDDSITLEEANSNGRGYLTYDNFEKRMEQKISKVLLGHSDALDSVPGKLGASQGEDSPVTKALRDKQSRDAKFLAPIINEELIPRMRMHGFPIPIDYHFEYKNDDEEEEYRRRQDDSNQKTATVMKTVNDAGGDITDEAWQWFEDRTGIKGIKKKEAPPPPPNLFGGPDNSAQPGQPNDANNPVQNDKNKALKDKLQKQLDNSKNGIRKSLQRQINKLG